MPARRGGPWRTFRFARERMRSVRRFGTPRRRRDVDEYAGAFDLHREGRHTILFESRLPDAGATMELPTVPRTNDVIAVETAVAERPTDVVADVRHRAKLSILERDRKSGGSSLAALQRDARDFLGAADVDPFLFIGHGVLPILVFLFRARRRLVYVIAFAATLRLRSPAGGVSLWCRRYYLFVPPLRLGAMHEKLHAALARLIHNRHAARR